jgi:uncharacterized protein YdaU (DUF1376 family)
MQQEQHIDIDWIKLRVDKLMTSPDVQQMEAHEFGAYMLILLTSFYQKKRGHVKSDEAYLRKITRLSASQWKKSKDLILSKFKTDKDGDLYNERWLSEIRDAEQYIISNKNRTQTARETRLGNKPPVKPYSDKSTANGIDSYIEYREAEFAKLDENLQKAFKINIGIERPIVWANKKVPVKYFDLVECIIRLREDVEWQSSIMINHTISKQKLLSMIYEFVKLIKDSTVYKTYDGYDGEDGKENFIKHFVNWLKMNLNK